MLGDSLVGEGREVVLLEYMGRDSEVCAEGVMVRWAEGEGGCGHLSEVAEV